MEFLAILPKCPQPVDPFWETLVPAVVLQANCHFILFSIGRWTTAAKNTFREWFFEFVWALLLTVLWNYLLGKYVFKVSCKDSRQQNIFRSNGMQTKTFIRNALKNTCIRIECIKYSRTTYNIHGLSSSVFFSKLANKPKTKSLILLFFCLFWIS